jgi:hypothetical protein
MKQIQRIPLPAAENAAKVSNEAADRENAWGAGRSWRQKRSGTDHWATAGWLTIAAMPLIFPAGKTIAESNLIRPQQTASASLVTRRLIAQDVTTSQLCCLCASVFTKRGCVSRRDGFCNTEALRSTVEMIEDA